MTFEKHFRATKLRNWLTLLTRQLDKLPMSVVSTNTTIESFPIFSFRIKVQRSSIINRFPKKKTLSRILFKLKSCQNHYGFWVSLSMSLDYKITECSKSAWGSINNVVVFRKGGMKVEWKAKIKKIFFAKKIHKKEDKSRTHGWRGRIDSKVN